MDPASVGGNAAVGNAPEPAGAAASPAPFRVLMVCTANRVRSAMAERMLRHALAGAAPGFHVEVTGAGTRTVDGLSMFPQAAAELEQRGIDASRFRSHALTENGVLQADLVLTATREHRSTVLEQVPLALKRSFTLLEFAALMEKLATHPVGMTQPPDGRDQAGLGAPTDALRVLVRQAAAQRGAAEIADDEYDIADPAGRPEDEYRYAARLIEYATATIARAFAGVVAPASAHP
jgi:protein-tyrosine phosphatase